MNGSCCVKNNKKILQQTKACCEGADGADRRRCFEPVRVKPTKLRIHHKLAKWPARLRANIFNQLGQYAYSPGKGPIAMHNSPSSFLAVSVNIVNAHSTC